MKIDNKKKNSEIKKKERKINDKEVRNLLGPDDHNQLIQKFENLDAAFLSIDDEKLNVIKKVADATALSLQTQTALIGSISSDDKEENDHPKIIKILQAFLETMNNVYNEMFLAHIQLLYNISRNPEIRMYFTKTNIPELFVSKLLKIMKDNQIKSNDTYDFIITQSIGCAWNLSLNKVIESIFFDKFLYKDMLSLVEINSQKIELIFQTSGFLWSVTSECSTWNQEAKLTQNNINTIHEMLNIAISSENIQVISSCIGLIMNLTDDLYYKTMWVIDMLKQHLIQALRIVQCQREESRIESMLRKIDIQLDLDIINTFQLSQAEIDSSLNWQEDM